MKHRSIAYRIPLGLVVAAILCSNGVVAMDWETAAEVATCRRHSGYEKLAARAGDLLREHGIHSELDYLAKPDKSGIEALTTDPERAGRWVLYVNVRDAAEARRIVASAIKDGLRITLSTKDPTPQVSATPN